ncbi:hypothetical protein BKA82DRAFT_4160069 [Pisolithus tinctorius]|nr:hypothetical protein BKA82DRAFT_4160069 [Pisolithus tinctorius]
MRWPCGLLTFPVELSAHTLVTFSASTVAGARRGISKYLDDVTGFAGGVAGYTCRWSGRFGCKAQQGALTAGKDAVD